MAAFSSQPGYTRNRHGHVHSAWHPTALCTSPSHQEHDFFTRLIVATQSLHHARPGNWKRISIMLCFPAPAVLPSSLSQGLLYSSCLRPAHARHTGTPFSWSLHRSPVSETCVRTLASLASSPVPVCCGDAAPRTRLSVGRHATPRSVSFACSNRF